ncbi:DUF4123 domain-containing protein [Serratia marcescens]|uniref:DUF4123 domain-containing protein n=1 Tax=Serratia marcescens TaxID=615 RepID=UPI000DFE8AC2|nr:DUF4123 domain-containing protein [Serratia marcescens]BBO63734.1 hypothetical protein SMATCC274_29970 [Serratia marcescens]CAI0892121.1 Uncharacterised protein [Serratia marcescens]SUJ10067.1 Uncharacterised protein [Serratia marcescens]
MTTQWIEEVAVTCRASGTDYLDIIVDQVGLDFSVIPALNALSIEWQSLYHGLPEAFIVDDAPLMARIILDDLQQMQWLQDISRQVVAQTPLLLLCSSWPFSALSGWLSQCVDILQEGRSGILRFYDTRIFPLLFTHVLSEDQRRPLLRPALFWAWQDMDGNARGIKGTGAPLTREEKPHKIDLSDRQLESLMCVCDVMLLLSHSAPPAGVYTSRQALFSDCYQGMLEATRQGIILDDAREAWVMKRWSSTGATA